MLALVIVVFCCAPASANAQNTQYCCSPDPEWHLAIRHWWQGNAGYPNRIGGGPIWLIGQARRLDGFSSKARGLIVEAEATLTNVNARIGWASLRPYDAGTDGYSAELIVAHSLGFRSRFDREVTYLGPAFSYWALTLRWTGGVLFATRDSDAHVIPVATVGIVF